MEKCQAVSQSNAINLMDNDNEDNGYMTKNNETCIFLTARENARKNAGGYTHFLATSIGSAHFKDLMLLRSANQ